MAPAHATRPVHVPLPRLWGVRSRDVTALLVANGAFIVLMWVRHGGLDQLSTPGGAITAGGQLTALLGDRVADRGARRIRDPHTGRPAPGLRSLTVVGPSLALADAFATAAFAMGRPGIAWVDRQRGHGALGITDDDQLVWTAMLERLLVPAGPAPAIDPARAIDPGRAPG
jgi:ApbE family